MKNLTEMESYQELANAVVLQAVQDFRNSSRRLSSHPDDGYARKLKRECEEFFRSQHFDLLTGIDGERLLGDLRKEFI